jgi:hypothetical protein
MTKVCVEAGACGFSAVIRVSRVDRRSVAVSLTSECGEITALAGQLETLHLRDILKVPLTANPIFEAAGRCRVHPGCPVPCAVVRAAEVELGLSLPKNPVVCFSDGE